MQNNILIRLSKNLQKTNNYSSLSNSQRMHKIFYPLRDEDLKVWIQDLLPNTRLIIEPKIEGLGIALFYEKGLLINSVAKKESVKTDLIKQIKNIPQELPISKSIIIKGELYGKTCPKEKSREFSMSYLRGNFSVKEDLSFCAFQILNSNQNHFKSLQGLRELNFEVPKTEYTNFTSEVAFYKELWKEGKIFGEYPTEGIVIKVNSRKLQKQLGDNNLKINWAFVLK